MADEDSGPTRRRTKKDPEYTDVTCIVSIIGENRNPETGQKIVHLPGEDVKMKTPLAVRLANATRPRVAIGKEDREAARKNAKRVAAVIAKREGRAPAARASASE